MRRQHWFKRLLIIIALSSLAAIIFVTPVCAQDEQPPQPEEIPAEVVVDSLPEGEAPPGLAPALEAAAEAGVTLVDESGEPLALVAEESAAALEGGDPWYKVGAVTYNFATIQEAIASIPTTGLPSDGLIHVGAGSYSNPVVVDADATAILNGLKGLVSTAVDGIPQADLTGYIHINSVDLGFTIKGFKITATADEPNAGIRVTSSKGTLKIEDVEVTNSGTGIGIFVGGHNGPVILTRVKSSNNAHGGIFISQSTSTTITNSTFDWNGYHTGWYLSGMVIYSGGAVLVDGVSASNNSGAYAGLYIQTPGSITIKNSVVSNNAAEWGIYHSETTLPSAITLTNVYANGNWNGLGLSTRGNITLTGVHADGNHAFGADLDTCNDDTIACQWLGSGAVTIKDSTFDHNQSGSRGLTVTANGAVTLTNVSANGNLAGMEGARLNTSFASKVAPVKVTGGTFNDNASLGLYITAKGAVTVTKVKASGNLGSEGLHINNLGHPTAGVTISGSLAGDNLFNDNFSKGLCIYSNGAISVKYADADGNGGYGVHLDNTFGSGTPGVTLTGAEILGNEDIGLLINSKGNVGITGVHADGNTTSGARINTCNMGGDDACQWLGPGKVTIKDSTFDDTQDTVLAGLYVLSRGTISLTNISASNCYSGSVICFGAELITSSSQLVSPVTITNGVFNDNFSNGGGGFHVLANGGITLNKVKASNNYTMGAILDNSFTSTSQPVTINGFIFGDNQFNGNVYGLTINSKGTVSIKYAESSLNAIRGIVIDNTDSATSAGVTLTNVLADDTLANTGGVAGIEIRTNGPVMINGGHANNNARTYGLSIENDSALDAAPKPVTITNFSANGNQDYGIYVVSKGTVTMTNVNADGTTNNGTGIQLSTKGSVLIKGGQTNNNTGYGLGIDNNSTNAIAISNFTSNGNLITGIEILGKGVITLTDVTANNNDIGVNIIAQGAVTIKTGQVNLCQTGYVWIDNSSALDVAATPVTLNNIQIDGTGALPTLGINILSKGAISLASIEVINIYGVGGSPGIYLDNHWLGADISLTKVNVKHSAGTGIEIASSGKLTYKGGEVSLNLGGGIVLNRTGLYSTTTVTLSDLFIHDNTGSGMLIITKGAISLTNVRSNSNTANGMLLENIACGTATPCNVSLLTSGSGINEFNGNTNWGLVINTYGVVALSKINITGSGGGVSITNNAATIPANVTITGGKFLDNKSNGIKILSKGIITLNGVEAGGSLNGWEGAYLDNRADTTGTKGVNIIKSQFNENTSTGLYVLSNGAIVLNTVQADENAALGAYLINPHASAKPVTILASYGTNSFSYNHDTNLLIGSNGSVALSNLTSNGSVTGDGIIIDVEGAVSLTNITANSNTTGGVTVWTHSNVNIKGITAMFNAGSGASYAGLWINTYDTGSAKVTISNGIVACNGDYGIRLDIASNKPYTLTNVFYFGNNSDNLGGEVNLLID